MSGSVDLEQQIRKMPWQFAIDEESGPVAILYADELTAAQHKLLKQLRWNAPIKDALVELADSGTGTKTRVRAAAIASWDIRTDDDPTLDILYKVANEKAKLLLPFLVELPWKRVPSSREPGYMFGVDTRNLPAAQKGSLDTGDALGLFKKFTDYPHILILQKPLEQTVMRDSIEALWSCVGRKIGIKQLPSHKGRQIP